MSIVCLLKVVKQSMSYKSDMLKVVVQSVISFVKCF